MNEEERDHVFDMIRGNIKAASDSLVSTGESLPEEERFSIVSCGTKKLLDHILVSKNLAPHIRSFRILNQGLVNRESPYDAAVVASDHAPVALGLEWLIRTLRQEFQPSRIFVSSSGASTIKSGCALMSPSFEFIPHVTAMLVAPLFRAASTSRISSPTKMNWEF